MSVPGSGKTFNLSVISPEQKLFEGPAKFAVVPASFSYPLPDYIAGE